MRRNRAGSRLSADIGYRLSGWPRRVLALGCLVLAGLAVVSDRRRPATETLLAVVVAAHTAAPMRVGFGGFAPGFAYLVDGDPRLRVPRRAEPRTSVPAGSVALAGEFSAIYPRRSPGGWQLIGHTDVVLWDLVRSDPALLTQGMWVQFRAA